MSTHVWRAVESRDLTKWFRTRLESETEDLRQLLFYAPDAIVPRTQPLYLLLLLEVIATRAKELDLPQMLVMEVVGASLGLPMQRVGPGTPLGADNVHAFTRAAQASATGTPAQTDTRPSASPESPVSLTPETHDPGKIRIVRAGDIARKVIATLLEYTPHPSLSDVLAHFDDGDMHVLFDTLSIEIAKMITEGLQ